MNPERTWVRWTWRVVIGLLVFVGLNEISSYMLYWSDCSAHPDHINSCQQMFWRPFWGSIYCTIGILFSLRRQIRKWAGAVMSIFRRRTPRECD
jgi:hypothetical protein